MQNEINNTNTNVFLNLGAMTDKELTEISRDLYLDLPFPFLREIGRTLAADKTAASEDILRLFSAIRTGSEKDISNLALAELFADDSEIINTLNDLYGKAHYLGMSDNAPLRFEDLTRVSSRYLERSGAHTPKLITNDIYTDSVEYDITDKNGNKLSSLSLDLSPALPYGYVKEASIKKVDASKNKAPLLVHGIELVLISKKDADAEDRERSYAEMMNDPRAEELIITSEKIGTYGIIGAILKLSEGAHIDLSDISSLGENAALADLATKFEGCRICAASFSRADDLISLCDEYGLCAEHIANVLTQPYIIITDNGKTINLKRTLIEKAMHLPAPVSIRAKAESFGAASASSDVTLKTNYGETLELGKVHSLTNDALLCAVCSDELSFTAGINVAIDTLFLLLSKGADRRKTELSVKIGSKYEDMAKMLSAILGVYRVMTELCLPDSQPEISFLTNSENYLFCSAGTKPAECERDIPDIFSENCIENKLYLVSFGRSNKTTPAFMPDFNAVRRACDDIHMLISQGIALSVRPFNSSIDRAIRKMSKDGITVKATGPITINSNLNIQGFLVETAPNTVLNHPLLGKITFSEKEENTDVSVNTEETSDSTEAEK